MFITRMVTPYLAFINFTRKVLGKTYRVSMIFQILSITYSPHNLQTLKLVENYWLTPSPNYVGCYSLIDWKKSYLY